MCFYLENCHFGCGNKRDSRVTKRDVLELETLRNLFYFEKELITLLFWKLGAKPPSSPTAVASRPYLALMAA